MSTWFSNGSLLNSAPYLALNVLLPGFFDPFLHNDNAKMAVCPEKNDLQINVYSAWFEKNPSTKHSLAGQSVGLVLPRIPLQKDSSGIRAVEGTEPVAVAASGAVDGRHVTFRQWCETMASPAGQITTPAGHSDVDAGRSGLSEAAERAAFKPYRNG